MMEAQRPRIGFRTEKVNGQRLYGMANIAFQIASRLAQRDDIRFHLVRTASHRHPLYGQCRGIAIPSFPRALWARVAPAFVRMWGLDLMHYPDHKVFPLYCRPARKVIVTIHGLMPLQVPADMIYKPLDNRTVHLLSHARDYVDAITTVSEFSRQSLVKEFGIDPEMIQVVPNGIDTATFHPDAKSNDGILAEKQVTSPYLLHVSNLKKVKNVQTVLKAFKQLAASNPCLTLIVAGGLPDTLDHAGGLVDELNLSGRVRFLGVVTGTSLATLYRGAAALLFPSHYESFGLPVLEAMACGCPVIASDIPAFREFAEGSALLFPVLDAEAMAAAAQEILNNPDYHAKLAAAGIESSRKYTWQTVADQHAALYFKVLNGEQRRETLEHT